VTARVYILTAGQQQPHIVAVFTHEAEALRALSWLEDEWDRGDQVQRAGEVTEWAVIG